MPDRYCSRCHTIIAAADWANHQLRHQQQTSDRHGTTAGHRAQRARVLQRARYHCEHCGTGGALELHHTDGDWRNDTDDTRVLMLCHACHVATYTGPKIFACARGSTTTTRPTTRQPQSSSTPPPPRAGPRPHEPDRLA